MLQVRLIQVAGLLKVVRFDPPTRVESSNALLGHAKEVRSQLQDLWRGFTVKSVKQSTSSAEYHGVSDGN